MTDAKDGAGVSFASGTYSISIAKNNDAANVSVGLAGDAVVSNLKLDPTSTLTGSQTITTSRTDTISGFNAGSTGITGVTITSGAAGVSGNYSIATSAKATAVTNGSNTSAATTLAGQVVLNSANALAEGHYTIKYDQIAGTTNYTATLYSGDELDEKSRICWIDFQ